MGVVVVVQDGSPSPTSGRHITIVIFDFTEQFQDSVVGKTVGRALGNAGDVGFWRGSIKTNQHRVLVQITFRIGDSQRHHARCGVRGLLVGEGVDWIGGRAGEAISKIPKPLEHGPIGVDGPFTNKFNRQR